MELQQRSSVEKNVTHQERAGGKTESEYHCLKNPLTATDRKEAEAEPILEVCEVAGLEAEGANSDKVMELQQRSSMEENVYEGDLDRAAAKTEDVYQCLQRPPRVTIRKETAAEPLLGMHQWRKMVMLLLIVNALLLTAILFITGMHYSHFKQTTVAMASSPHNNKVSEVWLLHKDKFYLFWSSHSDCATAKEFCANRNAGLAVVTQSNKAWLKSHTMGKNMLVLREQFENSGDFEGIGLMDDDDYDCEVSGRNFSLDMDRVEVEGWVCEWINNRKQLYHLA